MTEATVANSEPSALDREKRERIERLQQRRQGGPARKASTRPVADAARERSERPPAPRPRRRRHSALGTRIASLGLAGTAMFTIIAVLALGGPTPVQAPTGLVQDVTVTRPVVVVVHRTRTVVTQAQSATTAVGPAPVPVPSPAPAVIEQPVASLAGPVEVQVEAPPVVVTTRDDQTVIELRAQPVVRTVEAPAPDVPKGKTSGSR